MIKMQEHRNSTPSKSILGFCIFASIFWIIGLPLLLNGYKNVCYMKNFTQQGNRTIATITDVHEYEVSNGDGDYSDKRDVYVTYTADGKTYANIIKEASIYHAVGEQIEIYYSSDDPTVIMSPENVKSESSFQIPMGILMIVLPFLILMGGKVCHRKRAAN